MIKFDLSLYEGFIFMLSDALLVIHQHWLFLESNLVKKKRDSNVKKRCTYTLCPLGGDLYPPQPARLQRTR